MAETCYSCQIFDVFNQKTLAFCQAFFDAVDVVAGQPRHVVEPFVRAFVRAVLADGVVRPGERKALADVLCAVRERGYSPKMFGLK